MRKFLPRLLWHLYLRAAMPLQLCLHPLIPVKVVRHQDGNLDEPIFLKNEKIFIDKILKTKGFNVPLTQSWPYP